MARGKRTVVQARILQALGSVRLRAQKPGNGNGMGTRGQAVTAYLTPAVGPGPACEPPGKQEVLGRALERMPTLYPSSVRTPTVGFLLWPLCSDGILHWRRSALSIWAHGLEAGADCSPEVWQILPLGQAASMSSSFSDPYFKTQKMSVFLQPFRVMFSVFACLSPSWLPLLTLLYLCCGFFILFFYIVSLFCVCWHLITWCMCGDQKTIF